ASALAANGRRMGGESHTRSAKLAVESGNKPAEQAQHAARRRRQKAMPRAPKAAMSAVVAGSGMAVGTAMAPLPLSVTAAVFANSRPSTVAPMPMVMAVSARTLPAK